VSDPLNPVPDQIIPMSLDHDFTRLDERSRISLTNGKIVENSAGCQRIIPNTNDYPIEVIREQKLALGLHPSSHSSNIDRWIDSECFQHSLGRWATLS